MSAAGTVVATSADGAGDMPSLEPAAAADAPGDGAPTFSEVLSLSSPDLPSPSGTSAPSAPPPDPGATNGEMDSAPTTVPERPHSGGASSTGRRGHRATDSSGPRERSGRGAGSTAAPATDGSGATGTVSVPSPSSTTTQAETSGSEPEESAAGALSLVPSTVAAPPDPATSAIPGTEESDGAGTGSAPQLVPTALDGGPAQANDPARANDSGSKDSLSNEAVSGTVPLDESIGSGQNGIRSTPTPTVRTPDGTIGSTDVRVSSDRAMPLGSNAFHVGSEPLEATGSSSVAPASVPSVGAGTVATTADSVGEAPELAEFPDGGAGTAAPTLDVSDLAASISRPLAGGSGEYSVQVSLHPPELGEVRALLSLQGDVLHVTLTPEHPSGFEALSDAMPALREHLAGGGVEVNVTLGQPGDTQGEEGRSPADPGSTATGASDDAIPPVTPAAFSTNSGSPGRIHLVL